MTPFPERLVFWGRREVIAGFAGEGTYVRSLVANLTTLGVAVQTSHEWRATLSGTDVVHLSNLHRVGEVEWRLRQARCAGAAVVLTPIFVEPAVWAMDNRGGAVRTLRRAGLSIRALETAKATVETLAIALETRELPALGAFRSAWWRQRELLRKSDLVWVNSRLEDEAIQQEFAVTPTSVVVPFASVSEEEFRRYGPTADEADYDVAVIGYLAPVKNQITILKALAPLKLRGILVGTLGARHRSYGERVLAQAKDAAWEWRSGLPRGELLRLLGRTRAVVQVSRFETCGMSALEALGLGRQAVLTSRGFGREYFGDRVEYVDPDDVQGIRATVQKAVGRAWDPAQGEEVRRRFSWRRSAQTAAASLEVLAARRGGSSEAA